MFRIKWHHIIFLVIPFLAACTSVTTQSVAQLETRVAELEAQAAAGQEAAPETQAAGPETAQLETRLAALEAQTGALSDEAADSAQETQAAQTQAEDAFELALTLAGRAETAAALPGDPALSARVTELEQVIQSVLTTTVNLDIAYQAENSRLLPLIIDKVRVEAEYTDSFESNGLLVAFAHIESRATDNDNTLLYSLAAAPDLPAGSDDTRWQLYSTLGGSSLVVQEGDLIAFNNTERIESTNGYATLDDLNTVIVGRLNEIKITALVLVDVEGSQLPTRYEFVFFKNEGSGVPGDGPEEQCRYCQSPLYSWTNECQWLINSCQLFGHY